MKNKDIAIYGIKGEYRKGEAAYPTIELIVRTHLNDENYKLSMEKESSGKPYIDNLDDINISISHSDEIWLIMLCKNPCGIDIQKVTGKDYLGIINKFLTKEESSYIETYGENAFYNIWTMKEALGKFIGTGIRRDMPSFVENNRLIKSLEYKENKIIFENYQLFDEYFVSYCTYDGINIKSLEVKWV